MLGAIFQVKQLIARFTDYANCVLLHSLQLVFAFAVPHLSFFGWKVFPFSVYLLVVGFASIASIKTNKSK